MAENNQNDSDQEKTEDPSQHRLDQARKEGNVAQSKDVTSLFVLIACISTTYLMGPSLLDSVFSIFRFFWSQSATFLVTEHNLREIFTKFIFSIAKIVLPIAAAGFFAGLLGSIVQIGLNFSTKPLEPKIDKLNPINGFKRLFSMNAVVEGAKTIFKLIAVILVTFLLVKDEVVNTPELAEFEAIQILAYMGDISFRLISGVGIALFVISLADLAWQKFQHFKKLKMTKQQAKQEHKEREGDPMVKARIKSIQREMARKRMMQDIETADVIVTNPTHIAVAIKYDAGKMAAPKVVAKGADHLALKIREIAKKFDVPIVENVLLARALHKSVKVGKYVPRALYQAVAEVLAYIYRLRGKI